MTAWLAVGFVGAAWLYRYVRGLPFRWLPWPIPSSQTTNASDALKAVAGIIALIGAVLTAIYAYRKQLLSEGDALRADALDFSRRYSEALTRLGSEKAAIRLGGAYAMARLADDGADQRQTCVDELCAYLRLPYTDDTGHEKYVPGEDQVRDTVQRLIEAHVRYGKTAVSGAPTPSTSPAPTYATSTSAAPASRTTPRSSGPPSPGGQVRWGRLLRACPVWRGHLCHRTQRQRHDGRPPS